MTSAPDSALDKATVSEPFTPQEQYTLHLICETLLPSIDVDNDPHGFYKRSASDLVLTEHMVEALVEIASSEDLRLIRLFLQVIEIGWLNGLLCRIGRPFSNMTPRQREQLLHSWRLSRFNFRRMAFQSLKRLAVFLYYALPDETGRNSNWDTMAYPPPPHMAPEHPISAIMPVDSSHGTGLQADVVIVGSGAGGGVVAYELAAAGLDVVVLEKGSYYAEPDFNGSELEGTRRLYENKGVVPSDDQGMLMMAGSTLGGGTTVNWSASFRTPSNVLDEWARNYGVYTLHGPDYQTAMDKVTERLGVNTNQSISNRQNAILEAGAERLGYDSDAIPRNASGCEDCGFCNFGCPLGRKMSTLRTYLLDAHREHGARIVVNAFARRVLVEHGTAVGVEAQVTDDDGNYHRLEVRARTVVVAAGALHTPVLLKKSGLSNEHIGQHLYLHPVTFAYGLFQEEVRGWSGKMLTRHVHEFRDLNDGYGVLLETAPIHPGMSALVLPWETPFYHRQTMSILERFGGIIVLTRDRYGGQVKIDRNGNPLVQYRLHPYDKGHLRQGLLAAVRILAAAGAEQVGSSIEGMLTHRLNDGELEAYLERVRRHPLLPNTFALLSAHQMGTCRLAGSPELGPLQPTGESWEVQNLYIADASTFPSASGVNPMITIMSIAHCIAQHIKASH